MMQPNSEVTISEAVPIIRIRFRENISDFVLTSEGNDNLYYDNSTKTIKDGIPPP